MMEIFSTEVITIIGGIVASIISGWGSWFFARKKYNSEVDNTLIENMQKSLDFYMKLSDDNKSKKSPAKSGSSLPFSQAICYNNCISDKLPHGRFDCSVDILITNAFIKEIHSNL